MCFNTKDHEAERKEAVRVILSRNPSAFDTKFKKNAEKAEAATASSSSPNYYYGTCLDAQGWMQMSKESVYEKVLRVL